MTKPQLKKGFGCPLQFRRLGLVAAIVCFFISVGWFSDATSMEINLMETIRKRTPSPFNWDQDDFEGYIEDKKQRNYFPHFVSKGGMRKCIEIGVQDGRFSEIFLHENRHLEDKWMLVLVDPAPTDFFFSRLGKNGQPGSWEKKGYLKNVNLTFEEKFSTDADLLAKYPDESFDFVYLDALHTYEAVKAEMFTWWKKVRHGGILAGHDYCNYGEEGLSCKGCKSIPACGKYTREGVESAESKRGRSSNQQGVVMAVQEWMIENGDDSLFVHHTIENFTRESLAQDGFDYDMVIRRDRNPSWFIYKP
mmetsp:Transcript_16520/g.40369  ORF Transcript_16520/g.40369 Transcript_16520/m.40369 type:complete len:306 (+) Transcript_16520:1341-2258(+)